MITFPQAAIDALKAIAGSVSGGAVYSTSTAVTSASTNILLVSKLVLAANPNRRGFWIYNNGANSIYFTATSPASSNNCLKILATFATWESMGPTVYTGPIYGIRNAGAGVCNIVEFI